MPWIGGQSFTFFEPVFNLADTAISTGVGIILVFNKRIFPKS
jgi:signal peptidase II